MALPGGRASSCTDVPVHGCTRAAVLGAGVYPGWVHRGYTSSPTRCTIYSTTSAVGINEAFRPRVTKLVRGRVQGTSPRTRYTEYEDEV